MRKAEKDLFILLKSLSQREKVNFHLYCNLNDRSTHIIPLFEAINSFTEFNEEQFLLKFADEPFMQNLAVNKVRLREAIFRSIRKIGLARNETVWDLFQDANFCFQRGAYQSAKRILKKLKKEAKSRELFVLWEESILLEKEVVLKLLDVEDYLKESSSLDEELELVSRQKAQLRHIRKLRDQTLRPFKKRILARGSQMMEFAPELLDWKGIVSGKGASSRIQLEALLLQYGISFYSGDFKRALEIIELTISLYEKTPFLIEEYFDDYVDRKVFEAGFRFELGEQEIAAQKLVAIKKIPTQNDLQRHILLERYYWMALAFELDRPGILRTNNFISEVEKFVLEKQLSPERRLMTYFRLSLFYLFQFDFQNSIAWSKKILNGNWGELLVDFQCMGRIVLLLGVFGKGDPDELEVFLRPAERFLKKRKNLFQLEKLILKFVKKEIGNFPQALGKLLKSIKKEVPDEDLRKASKYFDVVTWLEKALTSDFDID